MKPICSHPLFRWSSHDLWCALSGTVVNPWVLVFERSMWITPSEEQIADYRRRAAIVKELGGYMGRMEYELAGKHSVLSKDEVEEILAAVVRDNPTARIIDHWNGEGYYTMSVGVDLEAPHA